MSGLHFAAPLWLLLLPAVALAALAAWWRLERAARVAASLRPRPARGSSRVTLALLALGAAASAVAAARPQWGTELAELPRRGSDVVFVVDISRSMGAADVPPSRIQAAEDAIVATVERLGGERVGLVVFGGTARTRLPLTTDLRAAAEVVRSLEAGQVIVGPGTSLESALAEAAEAFAESEGGKLLVIISDGDDLGASPEGELRRLRSMGVDVLVAGVGTSEGATVPVFDRSRGAWVPLRSASGEPVRTRLNEDFLRSVAELGGGEYLGSDLSVLPALVRGRVLSLRGSEFAREELEVPIERFQLPLAVAVLAFACAAIWESRRRVATQLTAAAMAALLLAACASPAASANERGLELFAAGQYEEAAAAFREALEHEPQDARIALNLAIALHAAGEYEDAIFVVRRVLTTEDAELRARAAYLLGHHHVARGELELALEAFKRSLLERPSDDARHDYEVVYALLHRTSPTPPEAPSPGPDAAPPAPTSSSEGEPAATPSPESAPEEPAQGEEGSGEETGSALDAPLPGSEAELRDRIEALDRAIERILEESGGELSPADVERVLDLLAERARLAALRGLYSGAPDPNDY